MAILENIRKRTTILILIIGLALFAFVISGVFSADGLSGAKVGSTVGEINGDELSIEDFRLQVESASRRTGPTASSLQVVNQVWENEVRRTILGQQFDDLGIDVGPDQIINFIKTIPSYGQNPQFLNDNGVFDENLFKEFIANLRINNPDQYRFWLQDEKAIIQSAKEQLYFNLIKSGIGATLQEGELDYKLANDKVDIQFVHIPYSTIPDSTITVGKKEIQNYIDAHKEEFKQAPARDIQFVYFEEKASVEDEEAVKKAIEELLEDTVEYNEQKEGYDTIAGLKNTKDIADFIDRNSDIKFDSIYKAKKDLLPTRLADTLAALAVGELYGPFRDGIYFKVVKKVAAKTNASVKASHILITYEGAERANPNVTRTKEEAVQKANDLLKEALKKETVFAELARDNSDGPSAPQGGDLGYFQEGVMTPKFNDFAFSNPVGHIGMVETEFGYHVIKIDDKQDVYQLATLAREVDPSEATSNKLFEDATKFEMEGIAATKSFTELAKEKEYTVRPVNKIGAMDENLPGLGSQRAIVQWAFNDDTKLGAIKRFNISSGYVVVQLAAKYNEGLMSVEDASVSVLPKIRKERKAAQIINANKGKSLEALAKDNNVSVSTASALTVKAPTIPGAGREPLVVGTALALGEGKTSDLIEGESGVFLVSVTKKQEASKLDNYATYANALRASESLKVPISVYNTLKEAATIEDKRAMFY
ncbi:SurA N-terminal domain-containing protein [Arenibacter sp. GZD96]|uniref:peptidylprolyl isomerase n=1 Tax=Aurantibrevibacter litoralis TaxID=3106030 RepID=UPI002AFF3C70|nr:SurA N-terminal domain-containing protein [Arenibacter sp. GZD-96]MEA1785601.1 SurA N-terminal domain-containing protein [Arenibacter sp. GZD-96]